MEYDPLRRRLLLAAAAFPFLALLPGRPAGAAEDARQQLAELEQATGGRLGVAVLRGNERSGHRADERFPLCSTFKVMAVGAVLQKSRQQPGFLDRRIQYGKSDLVSWSPVSETHVDTGMTVAELCAAALQHSDNGAVILLMRQVGGPAAVTAYARSLGDPAFRLDRWEPELNSAVPGDERDTTTPAAMSASLRALTLGDALPPELRRRLVHWMKGNTTGDKRIRAGVPAGWTVADKTGSGDYGTSNDVGVLWPPGGEPIVLAVYFTRPDPKAHWDDEVIASATRIAVQAATR